MNVQELNSFVILRLHTILLVRIKVYLTSSMVVIDFRLMLPGINELRQHYQSLSYMLSLTDMNTALWPCAVQLALRRGAEPVASVPDSRVLGLLHSRKG